MQLSERAKQLIPKARIVSFVNWKDRYSQEAIAIFQTADNEGRYLSDEDLQYLEKITPDLSLSLQRVKLLRDNASDIVSEARQELLRQFPNLTQPGGDLYPPERADACWRDFWHFLRCITYGIAGQIPTYTNQEGLDNMQLLYQELRVPLTAMVAGLENLKASALKKFTLKEQEKIVPYFDHLIAQMKKF
jgi:allophycocyanin-B